MREPAATSRSVSAPRCEPRPTVGAIADAVGQCVVIFTFVPVLAVVPEWLFFELRNPLNRGEPVVLSFLLVRGMNLLLNAFSDGLLAGVVAGLVAGALLSGWLAREPVVSRGRLHLIGALTGAVAACVMVAVIAAGEVVLGRPRVWGAGALAFEIVSGLVCGTIAAPAVARLLYPPGSVSASQ